MQSKVFFYVQHLWGVGHVYRASRIARAMARHGFGVHLIWGGTRLPGFNLEGVKTRYLTPVRTSDVSFSQLLHEDLRPFTKEDENVRRAMLLELFDEIVPDIVITEAYPFGRRQMRFELLPLMERVHASANRPLVIASIRDIMQEGRKEKRVSESVSLIEQFYDLVLVHGDERFAAISDSLQGTESFRDKIRYTGLVTPTPSDEALSTLGPSNVLVSVGGGAFGQALTRVAVRAMQYSRRYPSGWVVSAGTELADDEYETLQAGCPPGMRIVRHVPGLVNAMKETGVSVSHAGYNTVADILRSGCRAVLCPYADGNETEQLRRTQIMERAGLAVALAPDHLTPQLLASAVDKAATCPPPVHHFDLDGAENTARIVLEEFKSLKLA